jgi:Fe-S cluster assembly iron-binding protein IscA
MFRRWSTTIIDKENPMLTVSDKAHEYLDSYLKKENISTPIRIFLAQGG